MLVYKALLNGRTIHHIYGLWRARNAMDNSAYLAGIQIFDKEVVAGTVQSNFW